MGLRWRQRSSKTSCVQTVEAAVAAVLLQLKNKNTQRDTNIGEGKQMIMKLYLMKTHNTINVAEMYTY